MMKIKRSPIKSENIPNNQGKNKAPVPPNATTTPIAVACISSIFLATIATIKGQMPEKPKPIPIKDNITRGMLLVMISKNKKTKLIIDEIRKSVP